MSAPRPFEEELLQPVSKAIASFCLAGAGHQFESRLQLLEATSSRIGGFNLQAYFDAFGIDPLHSTADLDRYGGELASLLSDLPMHPALAISALAREPLERASQRSSGAYHTDFRLAQFVAKISDLSSHKVLTVLDPACGAGILLVAVGIAVAGADRQKAANWIANYVFASDLSEHALRATRLSLASLTNDICALQSMWRHFKCQDSLVASNGSWAELSPNGFDLVVANPPWEKVKLTRHEYLQAKGDARHYGAGYAKFDESEFLQEKKRVLEYAEALSQRFNLIGAGEVDLYRAFLQLCANLVRPGGRVSILVPAGLIRSKGTSALRQSLICDSTEFSLSILENRAKFFEIDTRFKFLALSYIRKDAKARSRRRPIHLRHARGTVEGVDAFGDARIGRKALREIRPDFSVPEVQSTKEWKLFRKMAASAVDWSKKSSDWYPNFLREVDMTSERSKFLHARSISALPVIEGRMIQSHRFGAKQYVSGTGRKAIWNRSPVGCSQVNPQFWIEPKSLKARAFERYDQIRVGFCDITGQTNERSMMASIVPPETVCGNKVPTVVFPNDPSTSRLYVWLSIVNSLPFDWLLRRVITTTVNFFLLIGTRLPQVEPNGIVWRRLSDIAQGLEELDNSGAKFCGWSAAELRAEADLLVAVAYGLDSEDLKLVFDDFPLLDRGQPAIPGEEKSTITRDYLLLRAAKRFKLDTNLLEKRVSLAREMGSVPYIPSEYAKVQNLGDRIVEEAAGD